MSKKMASKMADSLRQVRENRPRSPGRSEHVPSAAASPRMASDTVQSPPASLYQPWDNLHPKRIWPD